MPAVFREYERLAEKILESDKKGERFNFFHFMVDLDQGPCAIKRLRGCGCGNDYIAITPQGDIYPCHQFVGMPEYKMGNLYEGTFNEDIKKEFSNTHIYLSLNVRIVGQSFIAAEAVTLIIINMQGHS